MDLYAAARAALVASSSVTNMAGQRVYPIRLPQKATLPAVSMQIVATDYPGNNLAGDGAFPLHRLQVDCFAERIADAVTLAEAVRAAMAAASTFSATSIGRQDYGETDTPDEPYRVLLEFNVSFQ